MLFFASLVFTFLACVTSVYGSWWEMARDVADRDMDRLHCDRLEYDYGLTKEQVDMCKSFRYYPLMSDVFFAAEMALKQCKRQFKHNKWNCWTASTGPLFGGALKNGTTREAAFVQALFTAVLSAKVTKKCSNPRFHEPLTCGCDRSNAFRSYVSSGKNPRWDFDFVWDDCSDNIKFGNEFASEFLRQPNKGQLARELMNKHNEQAGLEVISSAANLSCFCHGFSGSCALRTCWLEAPSMNRIGSELKKAYNKAVKVKRVVTDDGKKKLVNKLDFQPLNTPELAYLSNSQDFCTADKMTLQPGTIGRECNVSISSGEGSCSYLCCGRGHTMTLILDDRECCRFHWCCEVRCTTCRRQREAAICD